MSAFSRRELVAGAVVGAAGLALGSSFRGVAHRAAAIPAPRPTLIHVDDATAIDRYQLVQLGDGDSGERERLWITDVDLDANTVRVIPVSTG